LDVCQEWKTVGMTEDLTAAEWVSIASAVVTLLLAAFTASMAAATRRMAKSSEAQLEYMKEHAEAARQGNAIQQRTLDLSSRPKLKLYRQNGSPNVRFTRADSDSWSDEKDDRLIVMFQNVGGGLALNIGARLHIEDGSVFESDTGIPDAPGGQGLIPVSFTVPFDRVVYGSEVLLQVDCDSGVDERQRVSVRLTPDGEARAWTVVQPEQYGAPS
jgi:hypothetical protein